MLFGTSWTRKIEMTVERQGRYRVTALILFAICLIATHALSGQTTIFTGGGVRSSDYGSSMARPRLDWDFDGARILGHVGDDIFIWDSHTGAVIQRFVGSKSGIWCLQFGAGGKFVIASSGGPILKEVPDENPSEWRETATRIWDSHSGKLLWTLKDELLGRLSPNGKELVTLHLLRPSRPNVSVVVWDVGSQKKLFELLPPANAEQQNTQSIHETVVFSPDSSVIATEEDGRLSIFDSLKGTRLRVVENVGTFLLTERGEVGTFGVRGIETSDTKSDRRSVLNSRPPQGWESQWSRDGDWLVETRLKEPSQGALVHDLKSGRTFKISGQNGDVLMNPNGKEFLLLGGGAEHGLVAGTKKPLSLEMYAMNGTRLWTRSLDVYRPLGFSPDGHELLVGGGEHFIVLRSETGETVSDLNLLRSASRDGFGNQY